MNDVNEVYNVARIHDDYIVSHRFDKSGSRIGWAKGTITELRVPDDDDHLVMDIELPWGEVHTYGWDNEGLVTGPLSEICGEYGYDVSEFNRLEGEYAWLKIEEVGTNGDGSVYTRSRMEYGEMTSGPNQWKRDAVLVSIIALILIGLPVVLMGL